MIVNDISMMSPKRVILVRPQNLYKVQNYPPFGLILLGTELAEKGYEVSILESDGTDSRAKEIVKAVRGSLFVGITATTAEVPDAIIIATAMRNEHGSCVPLVWGGWHSTLFPEQMEASHLVDYAVAGEGEGSLLDIALMLSNERFIKAEATTGVRRDKVVRSSYLNLDEQYVPRYNLVRNIDDYIEKPLGDIFQQYYNGELRWLPYQSSRGCPHACAFCINPTTGNRKYRAKSPSKVAHEMASIVSRFGLTHVKLIDDNFFVQAERVREIFREANKLGVKYTWDAECRIDYVRDGFIDDEMIQYLKRNGLVQLTFGIESGSEDSLQRMRKGYRGGKVFDLAINAVQVCAEHDLSTRGSFVLDIPGDSPQDIYKTVGLIRRLRRYPKFACGVHTFRPYPKSVLCEDLLKSGRYYQPRRLEEWADEEFVRQYTDTAAIRRWQANYKLSSMVSFYESLESGFWLKPHQLSGSAMRSINRVFVAIARMRNRHQLYRAPIDRYAYIAFKDFCLSRMRQPRGNE